MKILKKFVWVVLIVVFLVPGMAFAQDATITKLSEVKNESDVPTEITENGVTYKLKDVQMKSIEKDQDKTLTKAVTVTRTMKNLMETTDLFPLAESVETEDGYKGTVVKTNVTYEIDNEHSVFGRQERLEQTINHGYVYETPYVEPYIEKDYNDLLTNYLVHVQLPLVKTERIGAGWYPARYYTLTYTGDKDGRYFLPQSQEILNMKDAPPGIDYQDDVLWLLGLEEGHYRIVGAEWTAEGEQSDAGSRRTAKYEIQEKGQQYVSYYARTIDVPVIARYTAKASYEGKATKTVKEIAPETKGMFEATAVYEAVPTEVTEPTVTPTPEPQEKEPPIQPFDYTPLVVTGAATASGIIILILWRRRRNVMILQWDDEAQNYRIIKRLRVIPLEPPTIDITKCADGMDDIQVQIRKDFIKKAHGERIMIICGNRQIPANMEIEDGFAVTKIS